MTHLPNRQSLSALNAAIKEVGYAHAHTHACSHTEVGLDFIFYTCVCVTVDHAIFDI